MKKMMAGAIKLSAAIFMLLLLSQCGKKKEPDLSNIVDSDFIFSSHDLGVDEWEKS